MNMTGAPAHTDQPAAAERPSAWRAAARWLIRREGWYFLELFALCGLAIVQPVLEVTGKAPDFFLFRRAGRVELLALVTVLALLPPLGLWGIGLASGLLGRRVRAAVHALLVAGLLVLVAVEAGKVLTPLRGWRLTAAGAVVGLAAAVLFVRQRWARSWVRYLSPAPLVFALIFLLVSPVSRLVLPGRAAAAAVHVTNTPPIVMIFLDELPMSSLLNAEGQVDARLFPNIARLARNATLYRNATGVAKDTLYAVPGMLTGRFPEKERIPVTADYPDNLFTLLGSAYDLNVYESVTELCPARLCGDTAGAERAAAGLGTLVQDTARVWKRVASPWAVDEDPTGTWLREETLAQAEASAPKPRTITFKIGEASRTNQPARFREFVDSIRRSERPTLNFLHILLPHQPWRYLPTGQLYNFPGFIHGHGQEGDGWSDQEWPLQVARQRHLLQLAYTDTLIGEVLEKLEREGLYDEALVVLTADHGVSFQPGTLRRAVEPGNEAYIAWVPLVIKLPGQREGRVDDRNVELVDLLPTIADVLDVQLSWEVDGYSLLGPERRPPGTKDYYNGAGKPLKLNAQQGFKEVLGIAARQVGDPARGWQGLFALGPYGKLVGTPAARLPAAAPAAGSVKLNDPHLWADVDPDGARIPVYVSGEVRHLPSSPPAAPYQVAISVNGTIGGVAQTFREGAAPLVFAAMVAPELLRPGANRLEFFLVEGPPDRAVLRPLRLDGGGG